MRKKARERSRKLALKRNPRAKLKHKVHAATAADALSNVVAAPVLDPVALAALKTAGADSSAVERALEVQIILESAVDGTDISWQMLAAIGIRESGFRNIAQIGGGGGRGVFQLDITRNPSVTEDQAYDVPFAARWAATFLHGNRATLAARFPKFTPSQLLQATAASYNFGTGNISGNPKTIDIGSSGNNYGRNVLAIMKCFG